uniref:Uncharacterized protein n=1 Tax=Schlesneria paludicola TaxID=360056 RepID=A0A7C2JXV8_9PLAN
MNWRQLGCGLAVVLSTTATASAGDKHQNRMPVHGAPPAMPPWMYERPYRVAPAGVWAPREPDWRSIDWSGPGFGHGVHRVTQAHSLQFEEKYVQPAKPSREPWFKIVISEFIPDDKVCGPGVR